MSNIEKQHNPRSEPTCSSCRFWVRFQPAGGVVVDIKAAPRGACLEGPGQVVNMAEEMKDAAGRTVGMGFQQVTMVPAKYAHEWCGRHRAYAVLTPSAA